MDLADPKKNLIFWVAFYIIGRTVYIQLQTKLHRAWYGPTRGLQTVTRRALLCEKTLCGLCCQLVELAHCVNYSLSAVLNIDDDHTGFRG